MAAPITTYKLIVLYMLENLESSLTNSQIADFVLEREYTNYFNLQQAIHELVSADLISSEKKDHSSCYRITEEGRMTLSYFEHELSNRIKEEVLEYLKPFQTALPKRKILADADPFQLSHGGYGVRCTLSEEGTILVDLTLTAPTEAAVREIAANWEVKSQHIYEILMEELL
ncbi:MAG: DUF4364 family protein [Blautia sp.]|nr:DUF4364 family protein [Blautia sp.]